MAWLVRSKRRPVKVADPGARALGLICFAPSDGWVPFRERPHLRDSGDPDLEAREVGAAEYSEATKRRERAKAAAAKVEADKPPPPKPKQSSKHKRRAGAAKLSHLPSTGSDEDED